MKVLIVDESTMFRSKVRKALTALADMEVVGTLSKGALALQLVSQRDVDLLLMGLPLATAEDLEVLEKIKTVKPKLQILVFSDPEGNQAELNASLRKLGLGKAATKPRDLGTGDSDAIDQIRRDLFNSVAAPHAVSPAARLNAVSDTADFGSAAPASYRKVHLATFDPMIVVIASSTGGPGALEVVVSKLKGRAPRVPVLLAQHMPETFTKNLAIRLRDICGVEVREAINGEPVKPGALLIAPGNFHMRLNRAGDSNYITLDQGPKVNSVRPAADLLFISAAQLYGPACAGFVLTGMGEDGCVGAKAIKQAGGGIMIQDKASCIVWGMPAAVEKAGAYDRMGNLQDCAEQLAAFCYAKERAA